jgi:hypothetical protein
MNHFQEKSNFTLSTRVSIDEDPPAKMILLEHDKDTATSAPSSAQTST